MRRPLFLSLMMITLAPISVSSAATLTISCKEAAEYSQNEVNSIYSSVSDIDGSLKPIGYGMNIISLSAAVWNSPMLAQQSMSAKKSRILRIPIVKCSPWNQCQSSKRWAKSFSDTIQRRLKVCAVWGNCICLERKFIFHFKIECYFLWTAQNRPILYFIWLQAW